MSQSQLLEILDILKNSPESIPNTDNYFVNSPLFVDMLSELHVEAHNFDDSTGCNFILFTAKDAKKKIELAAKIYKDEPGDKKCAVQYSCDFTHLPGGEKQLGMVLAEDINHKGWPTSYIISPTENAEFAKMVMKVTVDLINADSNANRDKALIDGAHALKNAAITLGVHDRSCITHGCRVPNGTRKNGKLGTKGSLCAYLCGKSCTNEKALSLTNAVRVVSDVLVANFVPSKYPEDFSGFIETIWERHGSLIATGGNREKHIRNTYLHKDPRRLGGRAVGLPGQSGSNNHGEKKNRDVKGYLHFLTKNIKVSERNNPVFIMAACALDLRLTNDLEDTFATKPVREKTDYDLLRHINHQEVNGFKTVCLDLQYMVCTDSRDPTNKIHLNNRAVIVNPTASFTANLPIVS